MDELEPQSKQMLLVEEEEDPLTERLLYGAQDGDAQEVLDALQAGAHVDTKDWGGSTGTSHPVTMQSMPFM